MPSVPGGQGDLPDGGIGGPSDLDLAEMCRQVEAEWRELERTLADRPLNI